METFGVVWQGTYNADEKAITKPDVITLAKMVGASEISCTVDRALADEALRNGLKISMDYTYPAWIPPDHGDSMSDYWRNAWRSPQNMINHLKTVNIAQFRNHDGIRAHIFTGEPCGNYVFDITNPPSEVLNIIEVSRAACNYIRSQDPTHPVVIKLNSASTHHGTALWRKHYYDDYQRLMGLKRTWIRRYIDFIDELWYDYYAYIYQDWEGIVIPWFGELPEMTAALTELLDLLVEEANGKPVAMGEMGSRVGLSKQSTGTYTFTEQQQKEYFDWYGGISKSRRIFCNVFKLVCNTGEQNGWDYGLFALQNNGTTNIPRLAVSTVKAALSLDEPEPPPPQQEHYAFDHWLLDGINVGTLNPINVLMNTSHTLTAVFSPILTISATVGGTTNPAPATYTVNLNSYQLVTALPGASYRFSHWNLDGANVGNTNPYIILMDKTHTLEAVFEYVPPPPLTATLQGYVKDEAGTPIPGATVACDGYADITEIDGAYAFFGIPAAPYILTVTMTGYQPRSITVDASTGGTYSIDLELVISPAPSTSKLPLAIPAASLSTVIGIAYLATRR